MNEIWANRLMAGTKTWEEVPGSRRKAVLDVLAGRVRDGALTEEKFHEITGEVYT